MNMSLDYYQILGIRPDAPLKLINSAHKAMLIEYHPDKNPNNKDEATKRSALINEARNVLCNPSKKALYDSNRVVKNSGSEFSAKERAEAQEAKRKAETDAKRAKQAREEAESLRKQAEELNRQAQYEKDNLEKSFYHDRAVKMANMEQAYEAKLRNLQRDKQQFSMKRISTPDTKNVVVRLIWLLLSLAFISIFFMSFVVTAFAKQVNSIPEYFIGAVVIFSFYKLAKWSFYMTKKNR
ncbi:J domain-containing protein [Pseudoalteromonas sp. S1688]|uniref:J domain-containing protein n=1 Tax=Pseudoalteromonas sp. S1688 TaxID=579511 RepID=UPI00110B421B|nr:J domain-containing protein [Pseudoalteromonas sp. S1688]TMP53587.1 hypothetical protein CWB81_00075 [Pseudoalteromonas sp. S1688]